MSYAAIFSPISEQSGARPAWTSSEDAASSERHTAWRDIWSEVLRTHAVRDLPQTTGPWFVCITFETLPASTVRFATTTKDLLAPIESAFGKSATNLARMLRISRPMIYHYREGMEPTAENKRRLHTLAEFANDWIPLIDRSFAVDLKVVQPEGRTLLDLLSDAELDFVALRRVIHRSLEGKRRDRALRQELAHELSREETIEERRDIVRERHVSGKPVYVGDPENPSKLIQILPDGRRIRGQMVKRKFVPDEK